jgi:uncharacterized membrane protein
VRRPTAPQVVLGLLVVAYIALFGTLSLRRHQNLRTNALDLGYTDQAVWNTLHGRPFRFSTYLDAAFELDIPIHAFEQPDVLLGYHVEPILAAIAPLYLIHDGPETLLWLQTVVIALGAIPLYLLLRHRARPQLVQVSRFTLDLSPWLALVFVLLYFLAPSLEAANLSDFHAVALSPTLLLAAFTCLETDRPWGFLGFALLAAMCKEEIGLLVAAMGLWAACVRRRRGLGLGTAVAGVGWFLLCVQVIMPHFSGLSGSAFLARYGHLGESLGDMARNLVLQPGMFVDWLRRPEVMRYLRDLWRTGGGLSILHLPGLAMALPVVAINALSSYDWMHSGGAHYSASIVPFLILSAAYGVDWAARQAGRRVDHPERVGRYVSLGLVAIGLVVALVYHHRAGISPLSRRFVLEPISEHARRAEPFIEAVNSLPPEVPVSASSGLYPHVSHRQRVYLFPTVSDAEVILVDVTGPPSPVGAGDQVGRIRALLDYVQFGVAKSDHGFLLLARDSDQFAPSPEFYAVFQVDDFRPQVPDQADVGGVLRLEGFDWAVLPVVRPGLEVQVTTYWRALAPLVEEYRFVFFFWDELDRLALIYPEEQVPAWYPTWRWQPGQVVRVTLPPLPVGDVPHAGVAVLRPGFDPLAVEGRLLPIEPVSSRQVPLREGGTVLELVRP